MLLHRKNVAGGSGTDGKRETVSIWELRGNLVDTRTQQSQVAIEGAIMKRA